MQKELIEKDPLFKLSFEFSILIIYYAALLNQVHKYMVSKRPARSGTSNGANAMQPQHVKSKAGFIYKMKVAAKQTGEIQYWTMLRDFSNKLTELPKIINSIMGTAKKRALESYLLSFLIF